MAQKNNPEIIRDYEGIQTCLFATSPRSCSQDTNNGATQLKIGLHCLPGETFAIVNITEFAAPRGLPTTPLTPAPLHTLHPHNNNTAAAGITSPTAIRVPSESHDYHRHCCRRCPVAPSPHCRRRRPDASWHLIAVTAGPGVVIAFNVVVPSWSPHLSLSLRCRRGRIATVAIVVASLPHVIASIVVATTIVVMSSCEGQAMPWNECHLRGYRQRHSVHCDATSIATWECVRHWELEAGSREAMHLSQAKDRRLGRRDVESRELWRIPWESSAGTHGQSVSASAIGAIHDSEVKTGGHRDFIRVDVYLKRCREAGWGWDGGNRERIDGDDDSVVVEMSPKWQHRADPIQKQLKIQRLRMEEGEETARIDGPGNVMRRRSMANTDRNRKKGLGGFGPALKVCRKLRVGKPVGTRTMDVQFICRYQRFKVQSQSGPGSHQPRQWRTPNRTPKLGLEPHPEPDRTQGAVQCGSGPNPISDRTPASLAMQYALRYCTALAKVSSAMVV
ncbi:hypothetical protein EDB84DRAFT_1437447 [Lactarius hengduanensis]|nr:hypothetical protein EDB84DRAFT_1437447 [Lactarius hengduanensis]